MRTRAVFLGGAALMIAAVTSAIILASGGPDPDGVPEYREVVDRTMSPFCPGLTLTECPTQRSAELRNEIAEKISAGWTNEEIDSWLTDTYGVGVLGNPRDGVLWLIPALLLTGGAATIMWRLARSRRPEALVGEIEASGEEKLRLEAELQEFSGGNR